MTPEEKQALLQFVGVTYGHSHKLDTGIVGNSQFVKPISTGVKQTFEQLLHTRTSEANTQPVLEQAIPEPYFSAPVPERIPIEAPVFTQPILTQNKVQVDGDTIEQLKNITLQLTRIGDILQKATNVGPSKKVKNKVEE